MPGMPGFWMIWGWGQEHFAQGRDLAEARALPEDSRLGEVNSEGFTSEEEHSDRIDLV